MTKEEKIKLICRNCQEILTESDLDHLIESGTPLSHYIGFEISGMVHLGTGFSSMGLTMNLVSTIFVTIWPPASRR